MKYDLFLRSWSKRLIFKFAQPCHLNTFNFCKFPKGISSFHIINILYSKVSRCSACVRNIDLRVHFFAFLREEGGPRRGSQGGGSFCEENAKLCVTKVYLKKLLVKSSKNNFIFYLNFTWLCVSWKLHRILKKYPFWKFESWFPSEVSKLTSANYHWNFRHEKKIISTNIML